MPEIGNIPEHWGHRTEMVEASSWERSYDQHFNTRFGADFCLTGKMERVWIDPKGDLVKREELPAEVVRASELSEDPELAVHAAAIQEHLTAMLAIKRTRRLAAEAQLLAALKAEEAAAAGALPEGGDAL